MTDPHEAARDLHEPAGIDATGPGSTITTMTARRKEMLDRMRKAQVDIGPETPDEASEPDDRNTQAYKEQRRLRRAMAEHERQQ